MRGNAQGPEAETLSENSGIDAQERIWGKRLCVRPVEGLLHKLDGAFELHAVKLVDRLDSVAVVLHLHETEAAAFSGELVGNDVRVVHLTEVAEEQFEMEVCDAMGESAHVNVHPCGG